MLFARLKDTRNTKVNQINMPAFTNHDVGGFEVAENHRWLLGVQVVQDIAELLGPAKHPRNGQWTAADLLQVLFQGLAFDKVHHQV